VEKNVMTHDTSSGRETMLEGAAVVKTGLVLLEPL
jgi:hypothetical protein